MLWVHGREGTTLNRDNRIICSSTDRKREKTGDGSKYKNAVTGDIRLLLENHAQFLT